MIRRVILGVLGVLAFVVASHGSASSAEVGGDLSRSDRWTCKYGERAVNVELNLGARLMRVVHPDGIDEEGHFFRRTQPGKSYIEYVFPNDYSNGGYYLRVGGSPQSATFHYCWSCDAFVCTPQTVVP